MALKIPDGFNWTQKECKRPFFFDLYANVQRAKRDTVTADIYYYITTEFGYAKRDLRLEKGFLWQLLKYLTFVNTSSRCFD